MTKRASVVPPNAGDQAGGRHEDGGRRIDGCWAVAFPLPCVVYGWQCHFDMPQAFRHQFAFIFSPSSPDRLGLKQINGSPTVARFVTCVLRSATAISCLLEQLLCVLTTRESGCVIFEGHS
jgi:hypothetical protein